MRTNIKTNKSQPGQIMASMLLTLTQEARTKVGRPDAVKRTLRGYERFLTSYIFLR